MNDKKSMKARQRFINELNKSGGLNQMSRLIEEFDLARGAIELKFHRQEKNERASLLLLKMIVLARATQKLFPAYIHMDQIIDDAVFELICNLIHD